MSLLVQKAGVLDSIQDFGRFGHAQLGINPSGAMDPLALALANALAGNPAGEAALELHFPAPVLRFGADALIALSGADFAPRIDGEAVSLLQPVLVKAGAVLSFGKLRSGMRCYLAVQGGFDLRPWLGSCSTNQTVRAGGWQGRSLQTGDELPFRQNEFAAKFSSGTTFYALPWQVRVESIYGDGENIRFCTGPEYDWLSPVAAELLAESQWRPASQSDRMGLRLHGPALTLSRPQELLSSLVGCGTIQLLPGGQMIILQADSQTTGGYPRIGQVIRADLPRLAQLRPGQSFRLQQVSLETAFTALQGQQQELRQLQVACALRLAETSS